LSVSTFGYHGKLLHIDLAQRASWIEEPPPGFWRIYGGGGLLATYLLLRDCPRGADAFDPANLLILTSSVVAGHPYAGLARFTAAAKSPLTGGIGETRCEGPFGHALKGCGADALVFHSVADAPTVVHVERGRVSFSDAAELWGQRVSSCVGAFTRRSSARPVRTASASPALSAIAPFRRPAWGWEP
jgi:aldehyde:ferredoxin oxidoreductase